MFKLLMLFLLLAGTMRTTAQEKSKTDVVYLKNNWVIRGQMVERSDTAIIIRTREGNIFSFSPSEVQALATEENRRYRGFGHYTEIGALAATKNRPDNVTTAAFSFQTVNGYRFNRFLFAGAGAALDLYATQTILPVFASLRGNLLTCGNFRPYLFMDSGYGFDITSSTTSVSYTGGIMFAVGAGFKVPLSNGAGFHLNAGYRLQRGTITDSGIKNTYSNNRIALRAGFYL